MVVMVSVLIVSGWAVDEFAELGDLGESLPEPHAVLAIRTAAMTAIPPVLFLNFIRTLLFANAEFERDWVAEIEASTVRTG
ncbi:hypothetical protein AB0H42_30705 [Nocardia sp. NPDC050799]|uniref:hypothetical protein n=1 Tax=Nocardia sp. NPDC050799 TaxID=3154842 RepID=UPI0033C9E7AE